MWREDKLELWCVMKGKGGTSINNKPTQSRVSPYFISAEDAKQWMKEAEIKDDSKNIGHLMVNRKDRDYYYIGARVLDIRVYEEEIIKGGES